MVVVVVVVVDVVVVVGVGISSSSVLVAESELAGAGMAVDVDGLSVVLTSLSVIQTHKYTNSITTDLLYTPSSSTSFGLL